MTFDPRAIDPAEVEAINNQASTLMKRGIGLMNRAESEDVAEALVCFDSALELRNRLPIDTSPILRYGLAACWLNRADALTRLGSPSEVQLALRAYDEGIALLRRLPLGEDPRFPRRLAIAFQNRGLALLSQEGHSAAESIKSFTGAIEILEHAASIPDQQHLLAVVWMNLAKASTSNSAPESQTLARAAALRALSLVRNLEADAADAAEIGLKARHVLCQTLATRVSLITPSDKTVPDDVHEATDLADEALGLVRLWERKGDARFRGVGYDFFRFGARVYRSFQPQFLKEFVLENTDPNQSSSNYVESAEMRSAAQEALDLFSESDCYQRTEATKGLPSAAPDCDIRP